MKNEIPMFKVAMADDLDEVVKVMKSGWIGQGPAVRNFERELGKRFNNENVLCLSAGTHGLSLALRMAGVKSKEDEVITTPLTCTATNMPIMMHNGTIVWADVRDDFNIDPESIKEKITDRTKAIIVVHWGGYPCDMEEISKIAHAHNIKVIEDCAHAYGSWYHDSIIGDCKYSDYSMMSFQAIKHLTCIDGGALFTREKVDYERAKLLRWYGIDRESPRKEMRCEEDITEFGYKYHMNDVCATVGLCNMPMVEENLKKTISNAEYYEEVLPYNDGIELTQMKEDRQSSYWIFSVLVEDRTSFAHMMGSEGIAVSRVHERNDKHTCFKEFRTELPGLEYVMERMISIPVGWWVTEEQREHIAEAIAGGW